MAASINFALVRVAASGRWNEIHQSCGIHLTTTNHRHHAPCLGCGGKDRFRINKDYQDTGRWLCGGGGDLQQGDGFALLGHVFGWSAQEQLQAVAQALGLDQSVSDQQRNQLREKAKEQQREIKRKIRLKEERARRDSNLLDAIVLFEDEIKQRQYRERNHGHVFDPTGPELEAIHALNSCVLESYRESL